MSYSSGSGVIVPYSLYWLKIARLFTAALKLIRLNREDILGPEYGLRPRVAGLRPPRSTADRLVTTLGVKRNPAYSRDHRTARIILKRRTAHKDFLRK